MWFRTLMIVPVIAGALATPLAADDVGSQGEVVCALQIAASCDLDGDCLEGVPMEWNIPAFIVIDLEGKMLSTTANDARPRISPIRHVERSEDTIYLQGIENRRAYSIVIEQASGLLSATMSTIGFNVSLFGSCTGLPIEAPVAE